MLNLQKNTLHQIKKIITDYKDVEKIVIFGSRANGTSKKLQILIEPFLARIGLQLTYDINLIRDILDENLKTPLKIDVINFYALNKKKLKTNILHQGKIIYECRKNKRNF